MELEIGGATALLLEYLRLFVAGVDQRQGFAAPLPVRRAATAGDGFPLGLLVDIGGERLSTISEPSPKEPGIAAMPLPPRRGTSRCDVATELSRRAPRRYRHGMASSVLPCQTASRRMELSVGTGCATTRPSKNACRTPWVEGEVGACASTSSPATMGWGKGSCWTSPRGRWPSWLRLSRGALMAPDHRFPPYVGSPPRTLFSGLFATATPRRGRGFWRLAG